MDDASRSRTHASLLARLQEDVTDESAWAEFLGRYGPALRGWCRRWQLQEADIDDVTQLVLLKLASRIRGFVYDPGRSFRAWLKTLARHAWLDFVADRQRAGPGTGDSGARDALETLPAREDLERRLEEAFDLELVERATALVRQRVKPSTWEAFHLTAVEGLSGAEAADKLGMQVAAVFMAKSNVRKLLQEEIALLETRGSP